MVGQDGQVSSRQALTSRGLNPVWIGSLRQRVITQALTVLPQAESHRPHVPGDVAEAESCLKKAFLPREAFDFSLFPIEHSVW